MRLVDFAFLADENLHPEVVRLLRQAGRDVIDSRGADLIGADDRVVLRAAHSENRVVLTHDGDFGRLAIAGGEPLIGIVYLRPGHIDHWFTLETLDVLFQTVAEVEIPFLLVAQRSARSVKIRLRRLPL